MNEFRLILLWVALSLLIAACGANSSQSNNGGQQQVTFQTINKGCVIPKPNNPVNTPTVFILRSATEWNNFWDLFSLTIPSMPPINFNDNQFIAVVDNPQSTSGHSIAITGVQTSSTGVIVQVVQDSPSQNCLILPSISQPFHIITTPNIPGTGSLSMTQKVTDCSSP
jgi:hypothetical protein